METVLSIAEIALPLLYAAVFGLYARHFFRDDATTDSSEIAAHAPLYGLLATHIGYMVVRGITQGVWPLATKAEFLSLLALSITAVYALTERSGEDSQTGMFFVGIALPFQAAASLLMEPVGIEPAKVLLENPIYGIHVISLVAGFAALAVGALDAIMYILLSRQLKSHNLGLFFRRLPPLIKLEEMSRLATVAGILLLGVGLALGHFVAIYVLSDFNIWDPKIIVMDMVWAAYLVGWIVVRLRGMSGIKVGYLSLGAYFTLMVAMVLSNTVLNSFHSFHP